MDKIKASTGKGLTQKHSEVKVRAAVLTEDTKELEPVSPGEHEASLVQKEGGQIQQRGSSRQRQSEHSSVNDTGHEQVTIDLSDDGGDDHVDSEGRLDDVLQARVQAEEPRPNQFVNQLGAHESEDDNDIHEEVEDTVEAG